MCDKNRILSLWSKLKNFLRRDISSFFNGLRQIEENATTETIPVVTVPHLFGLEQLDRVKYRREILDWRDEAIIKLGDTGIYALHDFSKHTRHLLDDVSVFGRMFPKPANKMLKAKFDTKVRLVIREEVMRSVNNLTKLLSKQCNNKPETPSIKDYWPDSLLSCIAKNGFKPTNHGKIIADIAPLVNGDKGVVRMFQKQVIYLAEQIMK